VTVLILIMASSMRVMITTAFVSDVKEDVVADNEYGSDNDDNRPTDGGEIMIVIILMPIKEKEATD